jgi:hypothetical protein
MLRQGLWGPRAEPHVFCHEPGVGGADDSRAAVRLIARKSLDLPVKGSKFGKVYEIARIRGYHCDS